MFLSVSKTLVVQPNRLIIRADSAMFLLNTEKPFIEVPKYLRRINLLHLHRTTHVEPLNMAKIMDICPPFIQRHG